MQEQCRSVECHPLYALWQVVVVIDSKSEQDFLLHKWHSANSLERQSFCIQYLPMQTAIFHVCFYSALVDVACLSTLHICDVPALQALDMCVCVHVCRHVGLPV